MNEKRRQLPNGKELPKRNRITQLRWSSVSTFPFQWRSLCLVPITQGHILGLQHQLTTGRALLGFCACIYLCHCVSLKTCHSNVAQSTCQNAYPWISLNFWFSSLRFGCKKMSSRILFQYIYTCSCSIVKFHIILCSNSQSTGIKNKNLLF